MLKQQNALLICGQVGCIFFVLLFLIQGFLRADYSSLKYPVSSLSIGRDGWIQAVNFVISGALIFLSSFGFNRELRFLRGSKWTSRLIGAVGLGLAGAGLFTSDPVYGYPTTEALAISQFSFTGHLHDFFSIFVFLCLPIACFRLIKGFKIIGDRRWTVFSIVCGVSMLAFFILASIGFKQNQSFVNYAGLFQRLSIICGFTWISGLSSFLIKHQKQLSNDYSQRSNIP